MISFKIEPSNICFVKHLSSLLEQFIQQIQYNTDLAPNLEQFPAQMQNGRHQQLERFRIDFEIPFHYRKGLLPSQMSLIYT